MNRRALTFGMIVLAAVLTGCQVRDAEDTTGKVPADVFEKMEFTEDFDQVVGNDKGVVCHEIRLRTKEGEETLVWHKLWEHDFRKMSLDEKKAAFKADARKDMEQIGLACADPEGKVWLHQAYAQPHCEDCGGGCGTKSCPATVITGGGCMFGGVNCVITLVCCSGSCACG